YAKAGLASLMTAHVIFDALDPGVPATMSHKAQTGLLRGELGYDGVLVSDDLEMKAIADNYKVDEAAIQCVLAGVDLMLVCHRADRQRAAIEALVKAVESGRVPSARIEEANRRLDVLASRFAHPAGEWLALLGGDAHRRLAEGLSADFVGKDPTEALA
ncbi:MAG TPA: glycoside hydrolase family 3 N-terminal domain-containing protein, partial [Myxococcaceae bacterium]|nr:glycoside hydrolase family 3 N-terminal domain-containing protein [Myxococcaceae bacterium]